MLQRLRTRSSDESGFTLIELLVVILIIGILAAIAIPSFLNQKSKASDTAAKSGARSAQTAMESYATDNNGSYTGGNVSALVAIEPTLNDANVLTASPNGAGDGYTVSVTSTPTNTVFSVLRQSNGTTIRYCSAPGKGSCKTGAPAGSPSGSGGW